MLELCLAIKWFNSTLKDACGKNKRCYLGLSIFDQDRREMVKARRQGFQGRSRNLSGITKDIRNIVGTEMDESASNENRMDKTLIVPPTTENAIQEQQHAKTEFEYPCVDRKIENERNVEKSTTELCVDSETGINILEATEGINFMINNSDFQCENMERNNLNLYAADSLEQKTDGPTRNCLNITDNDGGTDYMNLKHISNCCDQDFDKTVDISNLSSCEKLSLLNKTDDSFMIVRSDGGWKHRKKVPDSPIEHYTNRNIDFSRNCKEGKECRRTNTDMPDDLDKRFLHNACEKWKNKGSSSSLNFVMTSDFEGNNKTIKLNGLDICPSLQNKKGGIGVNDDPNNLANSDYTNDYEYKETSKINSISPFGSLPATSPDVLRDGNNAKFENRNNLETPDFVLKPRKVIHLSNLDSTSFQFLSNKNGFADALLQHVNHTEGTTNETGSLTPNDKHKRWDSTESNISNCDSCTSDSLANHSMCTCLSSNNSVASYQKDIDVDSPFLSCSSGSSSPKYNEMMFFSPHPEGAVSCQPQFVVPRSKVLIGRDHGTKVAEFALPIY